MAEAATVAGAVAGLAVMLIAANLGEEVPRKRLIYLGALILFGSLFIVPILAR